MNATAKTTFSQEADNEIKNNKDRFLEEIQETAPVEGQPEKPKRHRRTKAEMEAERGTRSPASNDSAPIGFTDKGWEAFAMIPQAINALDVKKYGLPETDISMYEQWAKSTATCFNYFVKGLDPIWLVVLSATGQGFMLMYMRSQMITEVIKKRQEAEKDKIKLDPEKIG